MLIRLVVAYPMMVVTAESSSLQDHRGGGVPGRQPIGECMSLWLLTVESRTCQPIPFSRSFSGFPNPKSISVRKGN